MVHITAVVWFISCCMVPAAVWFIFQLLYGSYFICCMVHILAAVWFIFQLLYGSYYSTAAVWFIFQLLSCCMVSAAVWFLFQLLYGSYSSCCMVHIPTRPLVAAAVVYILDAALFMYIYMGFLPIIRFLFLPAANQNLI
jgi:hypothetical protein